MIKRAQLVIVGVFVPDDEWEKMKDVKDACAAAGVPMPEEAQGYFETHAPSDYGVGTHLPVSVDAASARHGDPNMSVDSAKNDISYFIIDLDALPRHATHLKVWMEITK